MGLLRREVCAYLASHALLHRSCTAVVQPQPPSVPTAVQHTFSSSFGRETLTVPFRVSSQGIPGVLRRPYKAGLDHRAPSIGFFAGVLQGRAYPRQYPQGGVPLITAVAGDSFLPLHFQRRSAERVNHLHNGNT